MATLYLETGVISELKDQNKNDSVLSHFKFVYLVAVHSVPGGASYGFVRLIC